MSRRHQSILNVLSAPYSNEYSFRFDGVDEYVDLGTGYDYFNYETGSYSVSCWAKWTGNVFSKKNKKQTHTSTKNKHTHKHKKQTHTQAQKANTHTSTKSEHYR